MVSARLATLAAALAFITALPASARSASDRAAFENSVAELAPAIHRPNPIAFLVGLGDWYCALKAKRGGGALDVQDAAAERSRLHPNEVRSADEIVAKDAAFAEAAKLLCP